MSKKNASLGKASFGCLIVLIGVILIVCFSQASGIDSESNQKVSNITPESRTEQIDKLEHQILGSVTHVFRASLEMKENVEFLLTPALLMQEVLSEEIVITYPTE